MVGDEKRHLEGGVVREGRIVTGDHNSVFRAKGDFSFDSAIARP